MSKEDYRTIDEYFSNPTYEVQDQINGLVLQIIKDRKLKKISQSMLAKKSGIPQGSISRLESLRCVPSIHSIIKLANALDMKLSLLPNK